MLFSDAPGELVFRNGVSRAPDLPGQRRADLGVDTLAQSMADRSLLPRCRRNVCGVSAWPWLSAPRHLACRRAKRPPESADGVGAAATLMASPTWGPSFRGSPARLLVSRAVCPFRRHVSASVRSTETRPCGRRRLFHRYGGRISCFNPAEHPQVFKARPRCFWLHSSPPCLSVSAAPIWNPDLRWQVITRLVVAILDCDDCCHGGHPNGVRPTKTEKRHGWSRRRPFRLFGIHHGQYPGLHGSTSEAGTSRWRWPLWTETSARTSASSYIPDDGATADGRAQSVNLGPFARRTREGARLEQFSGMIPLPAADGGDCDST